MSKKMIFIKPNDLVIIENDSEFILRKGFLHINEIVIDKNGSSKKFAKVLNSFGKVGNIQLSESDEVYDDFIKLTKFGFIDIEINNKFLMLVNGTYESIAKMLCEKAVDIKGIEEVFNIDDIKVINESKNTIELSQIYEKYANKLEGYNHIYYVDDFCYLTRLRAFNRLMNELDLESTIGVVDNNNIYLTGIKPRYTGCYECLEKHIITKFPGTMKDYLNQYDYNGKPELNIGDILILLGLILKDISNINKYGSSSLTGNVIHMYTPNFEYSYNSNNKNSSCSVCAKVNNVMFEEQNIRSINVIKEVFA